MKIEEDLEKAAFGEILPVTSETLILLGFRVQVFEFLFKMIISWPKKKKKKLKGVKSVTFYFKHSVND